MQQPLHPIGSLIGGYYRIVRKIGTGGFACVYEVRDERTNDRFALKEVADAAAAMYEMRFLSQLKHPGLPKFVDCFPESGMAYIVMELIDGKPLDTFSFGSLPQDQAISWAIEVLRILEYLHNHIPPVVVRDLKPSNIMLDNALRIRLIDFGIAKHLVPNQNTPSPLQGVGSAGYAAPELVHGGTTPLTDIYAVGRTLYYFITNDDPSLRLYAQLQANQDPFSFPSPRMFRPDLDPSLENIIMRATASAPANRFQSAHEFRLSLEQVRKPTVLVPASHIPVQNQAVPPASVRPTPPASQCASTNGLGTQRLEFSIQSIVDSIWVSFAVTCMILLPIILKIEDHFYHTDNIPLSWNKFLAWITEGANREKIAIAWACAFFFQIWLELNKDRSK